MRYVNMSKIDDLLYKRCGDPKNTYYSEQVITQMNIVVLKME